MLPRFDFTFVNESAVDMDMARSHTPAIREPYACGTDAIPRYPSAKRLTLVDIVLDLLGFSEGNVRTAPRFAGICGPVNPIFGKFG